MAALIIAIFPQNSSRGNWEEQQDRTDPNSRFELARKPAWLLAFRQFGLPKWKHDFESLEAGVFWSILSASLRLSERRKPLILLWFPEFSLSAQGFGDFSRQSRFSGKV